ncbi:MOXD1 homolog 1 [Drosophila ficusphila]|uniref:MOXD1 homolog 1 n=1 Tax=Drosophila ficusphila TaxID=30025 RepID=UPI0007E5DA5A|nr:MOXD1 homolog 1 [Drosophila ficusphila]
MSIKNILWLVLTVQLCLRFGCFATIHRHEDYNINDDGSVNHQNWKRTEMMDNNGFYWLKWWILVNESTVYFEVTVNTRGFAGLGFSKDGSMDAADIVLLWVDDNTGQANALDCHGTQYSRSGLLVKDDTQNYYVIDGSQNTTHTNLKFKRKINTCDPFDIIFTSETLKVLWSIGKSDPIHGNLQWHGLKTSVKALNLFFPTFTKKNVDLQTWDVTVSNVTITESMDTLYWCKIVRPPKLINKQHIVGYEALFSGLSKFNTNYIHHMTLFECQSKLYLGSNPSSWDVWVKSSGTVCNNNLLTPRDWESCSTPVAVWSKGSKGQFLPPHVGIPIGGASGARYYMLEIHYDNPNGERFVDHSGFRIQYSKSLRAFDAGVLISGVSISETLFIPPGQSVYRSVGICGPSCSSRMFPKDGIKIISGTFHSHQAGRKMILRHVRSGKELKRIIVDENYDSRHQQVHQLAHETVVLPGDYLITDCSYETQHRKQPTFGGYSTKEEMCLIFITYYPKIDLSGCYSMTPVREFFEMFGVNQFYLLNMTDVENLFLYNGDDIQYITHKMSANAKSKYWNSTEDITYQGSLLNKLIISEPFEFKNRTFLSHLKQLPWHDPLLTKSVQHKFITGKHMTFCSASNDSISIASEIIQFPSFIEFVKPASACPHNLFTKNDQLLSRGSKHFTDFNLSILLIQIGLEITVMKKNSF